MQVRFVVEAELSHTEGKFAGKDELGELIKTELENADPGTVEGDGGGLYDVGNWTVDDLPDEPTTKKGKVAKVRRALESLKEEDMLDMLDMLSAERPSRSQTVTEGVYQGSVECLRGVNLRVLRKSDRTGALTCQFLEARGAYKVGDTISIALYELGCIVTKQLAQGE